MRSSWHLGKILGVEVNIDPSWLVIFALITFTLGGSYFPRQYPSWSPGLHWFIGLVTSFLFFGSVLAHELTHSLVAIRQGEKVRNITLFIFGGVAQITEEPDRPARKTWCSRMLSGISTATGSLGESETWCRLSSGTFPPSSTPDGR